MLVMLPVFFSYFDNKDPLRHLTLMFTWDSLLQSHCLLRKQDWALTLKSPWVSVSGMGLCQALVLMDYRVGIPQHTHHCFGGPQLPLSIRVNLRNDFYFGQQPSNKCGFCPTAHRPKSAILFLLRYHNVIKWTLWTQQHLILDPPLPFTGLTNDTLR